MKRWLTLFLLIFMATTAYASQAVGTPVSVSSALGSDAVAASVTNTAGNFMFTVAYVACATSDPGSAYQIYNGSTPNQDSNGNMWNQNDDSVYSFTANSKRAMILFWSQTPINAGPNVVTYKNLGFSDCQIGAGLQSEYAGFFQVNPDYYRVNDNFMPFSVPDLNTTFPVNANDTYLGGTDPSSPNITFFVGVNEGGTNGTWSATSGWSPVATTSPTGFSMSAWDGVFGTAPSTIQVGNTGSGFTHALGEWMIFNRVPSPPPPLVKKGCKAGYAAGPGGLPISNLDCVVATVTLGESLYLLDVQDANGNGITGVTGCDTGARVGWTPAWQTQQGQVYVLLGATAQSNCHVHVTYNTGGGFPLFTSMIVFGCDLCYADFPISVPPRGYGSTAGQFQATMGDIAVGSNEPDTILVGMAAGYNSSVPQTFLPSSGWSFVDSITTFNSLRNQGSAVAAFYKEVTAPGSYPLTISRGGGGFAGNTFWMALRRVPPTYGTLQVGYATTQIGNGSTAPSTNLTINNWQNSSLPASSRVQLVLYSHTFATSFPFSVATTGGLVCPTTFPFTAPAMADVADTFSLQMICNMPSGGATGPVTITVTDAGSAIDWDLFASNEINLQANTSDGTALWGSSMYLPPTTETSLDTGPMYVQPNGTSVNLFLQGQVVGNASTTYTAVDLLTPNSPYVPRFVPEVSVMFNGWFDGTRGVSGVTPTGQNFLVTSARGQTDATTMQAAWGITAAYQFPVMVAQRLANAFGGPTTIDIDEPSTGAAIVFCAVSNPGTWSLPATTPTLTWTLLNGGGSGDWLEQAVAFGVPAGHISFVQQQIGTNNTFFWVVKITHITSVDSVGYSGSGTATSPVTTGITTHDSGDYLNVCGATLSSLSGASGGITGPAGTYLSNKYLGRTDGNSSNMYDSYLIDPGTYSLTYTVDGGGPAALGLAAFNYVQPPPPTITTITVLGGNSVHGGSSVVQ